MNSSATESPFRNELLNDFSVLYSRWHGYVSLVVCAIGIPLNIINITVLTRRKLQTPINCILTWLAVSDIATMVSYVPFALHFYCKFSATKMSKDKNSLGWMRFLVVYLNFSATTHTISIWLGVALAVFRHVHIQSPAKGNFTRTRRLIRARLVVCGIYIASIVLMIPHYFSYKLIEYEYRNATIYVFDHWNLGQEDVKHVALVSLFLYSIVAKLVPCVLIIVYGGLLLRTVHNSTVQRRRLSDNGVPSQRNKDSSRTTIMLLIVIVLFLLTELPQGILILCCIFLRSFFEKVYIPLGDMMDIIALINSGINFVLYCSMSQEFRKTFIRLFCSIFSSSYFNGSKTILPDNALNDQMHSSFIPSQNDASV